MVMADFRLESEIKGASSIGTFVNLAAGNGFFFGEGECCSSIIIGTSEDLLPLPLGFRGDALFRGLEDVD